MTKLEIVPLTQKDSAWLAQFMAERWGEDKAVAHNTVYQPSILPGFVAIEETERRGVITYHIVEKQCEIVTIDSLLPTQGVGTALIEAVKVMAKTQGCHRLWLITTNDNLNALRFYQKRGFSLVKINRNALERSRQLKPGIPLIGLDGIPLRDEIELELLLT